MTYDGDGNAYEDDGSQVLTDAARREELIAHFPNHEDEIRGLSEGAIDGLWIDFTVGEDPFATRDLEQALANGLRDLGLEHMLRTVSRAFVAAAKRREVATFGASNEAFILRNA